MFTPLTVELARPLYTELPNFESKPASVNDPDFDFEPPTTRTSETHSGALAINLHRELSPGQDRI